MLQLSVTRTLNWATRFAAGQNKSCGAFYAAGERGLVSCFRVNMFFSEGFSRRILTFLPGIFLKFPSVGPPWALRGSSGVRNAPPAHVGLRTTRAGGLERALIDTHAVIPISRQA